MLTIYQKMKITPLEKNALALANLSPRFYLSRGCIFNQIHKWTRFKLLIADIIKRSFKCSRLPTIILFITLTLYSKLPINSQINNIVLVVSRINSQKSYQCKIKMRFIRISPIHLSALFLINPQSMPKMVYKTSFLQ
jgi:hypothetical protein